ncbi:MAG TPA: UDP-glucose 4-epimerase GalE [Lactovum miscens]|uniref:UDP-glucose 4-epimerase GalE n=1 Tax=Lactovum miscens TaxID=190387 RepID=UPI002ED9EF6E
MAILILGGAGYIGSHMAKMLVEKGEEVIVIDNLITGHRESLSDEVHFFEGDIRDKEFLREVIRKYKIESIVHFAASLLVPESIKDPLKYFDNNVYGMISVLEVMKEEKIDKIIFSSSAAVYGIPEIPIKEDSPLKPINPYGLSKLMMEQTIKWASEAYGIHYVAFRYFNVAGADHQGDIGEAHKVETHLIPLILEVPLGKRQFIDVTGTDYNTPDGTNIRDYVHINDLVEAHYLAIEYLMNGGSNEIFNLGSSKGFSVLEIIEAARRVTGHPIPSEKAPRRGGDPDILVADSTKAYNILKWQPKHDNIDEIISTAWQWHKKHKEGY